MKLLITSFLLSLSLTKAHPEVLAIHGSGTTNPSKCFWTIMEQFMARSLNPLRMTYRAVGSTTGIEEFVSDLLVTDFGSGDLPLNSTHYEAMAGDVIHLPVLLGAVSFFHSVPNTPNLNLTGCLLARIFARKITTWDHEDIKAKNPNLILDPESVDITVVHRVKGSSSTDSITKYLFGKCSDHWDADMVGDVVTWPEDTMGCQGSSGVTKCILENTGAIGYIDSGHGQSAGLQEIELENDEGTLLNSKTAAENGGILAAEEGVLPETADANFANVSFLNRKGTYTWPIVQMTYVYVRKDLTFIDDPQEQTLLLAFLKALYDERYITQCAEEFGFTLPSPGVRDFFKNETERLLVTSPNSTEWIFEVDTKPLDGAGLYVISEKRKLIADVNQDKIQKTVVELDGTVATLQADMGDSMGDITKLTRQVEEFGDGDFTDSDQTQLKAALVMSAISFSLWILLVLCYGIRWFTKP